MLWHYWNYFFFGLQLCIKISIFNEQSNFWYSDHPEITPCLIKLSRNYVKFNKLCNHKHVPKFDSSNRKAIELTPQSDPKASNWDSRKWMSGFDANTAFPGSRRYWPLKQADHTRCWQSYYLNWQSFTKNPILTPTECRRSFQNHDFTNAACTP